jgi:hypothetical protein
LIARAITWPVQRCCDGLEICNWKRREETDCWKDLNNLRFLTCPAFTSLSLCTVWIQGRNTNLACFAVDRGVFASLVDQMPRRASSSQVLAHIGPFKDSWSFQSTLSNNNQGMNSPIASWFSLSAKGMLNLTNYENNFTFVVGESTYQCPCFLTEFLSPRIANLRHNDQIVHIFHVNLHSEDGCSAFSSFSHLDLVIHWICPILFPV